MSVWKPNNRNLIAVLKETIKSPRRIKKKKNKVIL